MNSNMKIIFFRFLVTLISLHSSLFTSLAQSDSVLVGSIPKNIEMIKVNGIVRRELSYLKNPFDGLYWKGPINQFSNQIDSARTKIFISGGAYLKSNRLPFSFSKKIMQSGFIDSEIKSNASIHAHNLNGIQVGYKYGAGFTTHLKKNIVGLEVSEESISIINYRRDLFNIIFGGNADYENDTAFFQGSSFANQDFHRLRIIFSKTSGQEDSSWQLNGSVSYLQGYHVNLFKVGQTELFTAPMGEYLWMQSQFTYQANDTSNSGAFAFNGNGVSLDVCISFPAGKSELMFAINDAGFINWNRKSLLYRMDTAIYFEGIELENILVNSGNSINDINSDTILNYLGVSQATDAFNLNLPLRFTFIWNRLIDKNKINLNVGFSFLPQYENFPLFFASSTFNFIKFNPSLSVSYGGFQSFNIGVDLSGKISNHFCWQIGSGQLFSWVMPQNLTGADLYTQFIYSF